MPTGIHPIPRWPFTLALTLGGVAFVGAAASFLAWVVDVPRLADWLDRGISIQPNTALGLTVAAAALAAAALGHRTIAGFCGLVVTAIGGATLAEWMSGTELGFDLWFTFGREWGRGGTVFVGRMGIPASVSLTLLGLALVISASSVHAIRRRAPMIALLTFCIGLLSTTGYLYGADVLFTVPRTTAIAAQTAALIVVLSAGVIALHPEHRPMRWIVSGSAVGVVARWAVPAIVVAPVALGWLARGGESAGY